MNTHHLRALLAFVILHSSFCIPAAAQRALQKNPATGNLLEGFKSGSNTLEVSATGTLKFNSGFTLTGGSYLKSALNYTLADFVPSITGNAGKVLAVNGAADGFEWVSGGSGGGLEIGTSVITGGTSGYVLFDNAGVLGKTAATSYGRGLLNAADAAAAQVLLDLEPFVDVMPYTLSMAALHSISGDPAGSVPVTDGLGGYTALDLLGTSHTWTAAQTVATGTLTASTPSLALTQTWNNASVAFDAMTIDVTNTASASSAVSPSYWLRFKAGGSALGGIEYSFGTCAFNGNAVYFGGYTNALTNQSGNRINVVANGAYVATFWDSTVQIDSASSISWGSGAAYTSATRDTHLKRAAGGVVKVTDNSNVLGTFDAAAHRLNGTVTWTSGSGSPEGVVTAPVGSLYSRTDGGSGSTLYVKESGSGNTGWTAK